jgi:hypothetical protein
VHEVYFCGRIDGSTELKEYMKAVDVSVTPRRPQPGMTESCTDHPDKKVGTEGGSGNDIMLEYTCDQLASNGTAVVT